MNRLRFFALAGFAIFTSCDSDNGLDGALGSYDNGFFVLNEGTEAAGSITYVSNDLSTVRQGVFESVNPGMGAGGFLQSMFFHDDRAFIISNMSNKITVVNRYTMEFIATISTGFNLPRYGVVHNGKAFVTNMASWQTGADDFVTVINLETLMAETSIAIGDYAERIEAWNGKIYVANGSFSNGDSITVIDGITNGIDSVIDLGTSPNSMEIDNGILYVLCSEFNSVSKLVRINLGETGNGALSELVFPASMQNASNIDVDAGHIYFTVGPNVHKISVAAESVSDAPFIIIESESDYIGYGFAVKGNRIFVAEATEDFSSDGKVYVYLASGEFIDEIPSGLGPNGIYFN